MVRHRTAAYLAVFGLALLVRVGYWRLAGTRISPDGHTYLATCDGLGSSFWTTMQGFVGIEYATFLLPFCGFMAIPSATVHHWVVVQILATSAATVLLADAAWRIWGPLSGLVAGIAMALLWETAQWDVYVLTESSLVFWLAFVFWAYARRATVAVPSRSHDIALWVALLFLAFVRPVGVPIVVLILVAEFLPRPLRPGIVPNRWFAAVAVAGIVLASSLVSDRGAWADSVFAEVWLQGLIVHDDPTFRYPGSIDPAPDIWRLWLANPLAVPIMAALKGLVLYLPFVTRFSLLHNTANLVTLVPILGLGAYGLVGALRRREPGAVVWLAPVVAVTLVAMATFVDYDWRYRVPVTLGLVMGTAAALSGSTPLGRWVEPVVSRLADRWRWTSASKG